MYSYVARQPILDEQQHTFAYELLFRDSLQNVFPQVSSSEATSRLVVEQFLQQNIDQLLGGRLGLINFGHDLLLGGLAECLPKEKVIIEILEDAPPDDALFAKVKQLRKLGYRLALDDFTLSPDWERFLPHISIIKFDLRATPVPAIRQFITRHRHLKLQYLAEKVEDQQEFEQARKAGVQLFQGFFFSRPEMVKRLSLPPAKIVVMQLLQAVNEAEINIAKVEKLLGQDVSLSLKLLRYVNFHKGTRQPISSFRQAAVYLGNVELRRFVSLVAASTAGAGKSEELYQMSLVRARFCELLAERKRRPSAEAFMVGLFSLLDVLMEQSMPELLYSIPLADGIKAALLSRRGELGHTLKLVELYERADWMAITQLANELKLEEEQVSILYREAAQWVSALTQAQ